MKSLVRADLEDTTCNLILIFQVSCRMQRKNRLDISYNLYSRKRGYRSKNHLKREDHRTRGSDVHHLSQESNYLLGCCLNLMHILQTYVMLTSLCCYFAVFPFFCLYFNPFLFLILLEIPSRHRDQHQQLGTDPCIKLPYNFNKNPLQKQSFYVTTIQRYN